MCARTHSPPLLAKRVHSSHNLQKKYVAGGAGWQNRGGQTEGRLRVREGQTQRKQNKGHRVKQRGGQQGEAVTEPGTEDWGLG